jgi:hypothetical protein
MWKDKDEGQFQYAATYTCRARLNTLMNRHYCCGSHQVQTFKKKACPPDPHIEIFSLTLQGVGDCSHSLNSVLASSLPAPLHLLVT